MAQETVSGEAARYANSYDVERGIPVANMLAIGATVKPFGGVFDNEFDVNAVGFSLYQNDFGARIDYKMGFDDDDGDICRVSWYVTDAVCSGITGWAAAAETDLLVEMDTAGLVSFYVNGGLVDSGATAHLTGTSYAGVVLGEAPFPIALGFQDLYIKNVYDREHTYLPGEAMTGWWPWNTIFDPGSPPDPGYWQEVDDWWQRGDNRYGVNMVGVLAWPLHSHLSPGVDAFEDAASQPVLYGSTDSSEIQRRGFDPQIANPVVTAPVGETDDAGSVNAFKLPGQHVCLFYVADRSPATVVQATSIDGELTFTRTDTGITGYWIAEAQLLSLDNLALLMLYNETTGYWEQSVGEFDVANNRYGNFTTPSPTALKGHKARGHLREEHDGQLHFTYLDATRQMKTAVCRQPRADGKMSWS